MNFSHHSLLRISSWILTTLSISLLCLVLLQKPVIATDEFVTTWQTNISNPADADITIPTYEESVYDYTVDWGDGTTSTNVTGNATHTYQTPGTYAVKISGTFPSIRMNNMVGAEKLVSIDAWGSNKWESMSSAFRGASNLSLNAVDAPDLSEATSLAQMFEGASNINADIGHWDVSSINNFSYMFYGASSFNGSINDWDMSSARSLLGMFYDASSFNQPLDNWSLGRVYTFNSIFRAATSFNQPLNDWYTSGVTDTRYMFQGATNFNQPVDEWRFPLVSNAEYMFTDASSFDHDVSAWNTKSLQRATHMFTGSALSTSNYDSLLTAWSSVNSNRDVIIGAGDTSFCSGVTSRNALVTDLDWRITDSGIDPSDCKPTDITLTLIDNPNQPLVIGSLFTSDPDDGDTHSYQLTCEDQYSDNMHFTVDSNGVLTSVSELSFTDPLDENQDNDYIVCLQSIDPHGFSIQKEFTITISQAEEVSADNGEVIENPDGESPEVVPSRPDNAPPSEPSEPSSTPQVLAASTDESDGDGSVLAETGISAVGSIVIGFIVALSAMIGKNRLRKYTLTNR